MDQKQQIYKCLHIEQLFMSNYEEDKLNLLCFSCIFMALNQFKMET